MGRLDPKQFNPKLILFQMMALQCAYYLSLGVFLGGAHALFGTSVSMDHFFTAKHMNPQSATGWVGIAAVIMSSLVGSIMLAAVVEKSRKCLDFGATIYVFHLLFCSIFRGVPTSGYWWVVHIVGLVVNVVIDFYVCDLTFSVNFMIDSFTFLWPPSLSVGIVTLERIFVLKNRNARYPSRCFINSKASKRQQGSKETALFFQELTD